MSVPVREIGFWTAVSLVVGNMIGSGVFTLPAALAPYGGLSLVGWAVSAGGSIALALVFATLARAQPAAGGPYAYTRAAFGDLAGFAVAWGYWISTWTTNAALAIAFVGYLEPFAPALVKDKTATAALAVAAVWVFTLINVRGIGPAGRVQVVTTALKIVPLAFVGLFGLAYFSADVMRVPGTLESGATASVMTVVTLTLWAFLGLECATIPAGSVRDPNRTIPRATITGTALAAAIYVVSTVGVMSLVPLATLQASTAPFADAARMLAGEPAALLVAVGGAVSCLGALNGWTLMVGQVPMAIAADRLFPSAFARQSDRRVPATGIVIGAVLSTSMILVDLVQSRFFGGEGRTLVSLFTQIILLATLSTLVPYFFCSLAVLIGRGASPASPGDRAAAGARMVAGAAFVYSVIAIIGAGTEVLLWGLVLLAAGVPVYLWMARRRASAPAA